MKSVICTTFLLLSLLLTGCTSIIDAATKDPIDSPEGKRTVGSYIDDKRLEVVVGVNIRKADPALRQSNIDITSYRNIVLITGQTPNQQLKELATTTAKQVGQVRLIHNELQIGENLSFSKRTSDSWIASKVKFVLLNDRAAKGAKIKTVTENGVVYLMGYVTRKQGDELASVISNISGIREVVKVFEYRG